LEALGGEAQRLLKSSLAPATWSSYRRGLESFINFRSQYQLGCVWPASQNDIILYISFLSLSGWAPSSINSHLSALAFAHKVNGWSDPTDCFLVRKMKEGSKRSNSRSDARLPVTADILKQLIQNLRPICKSNYDFVLFRAAFLLSFFGFLRDSEFSCITKKGDFPKVLSIHDVSIHGNMLELQIRYSKTDQRGMATKLRIEGASDARFCPVVAILNFLDIRPKKQGPLFIHFNGEPLTSYQFTSMLKKGVKLMGLAPDNFSSHSFRIGAATVASLNGISEDEIMEMGRWKSSAVNLYIRPFAVINGF